MYNPQDYLSCKRPFLSTGFCLLPARNRSRLPSEILSLRWILSTNWLPCLHYPHNFLSVRWLPRLIGSLVFAGLLALLCPVARGQSLGYVLNSTDGTVTVFGTVADPSKLET